jgi:hypothetical protein
MLIYLTLLKSPLPLETMSQFAGSVIPNERRLAGRDPWFDRPFDRLTVLSKVEGLTTLSEVEGESSEGQFNQIFPGSRLALLNRVPSGKFNRARVRSRRTWPG